jgi:hypothetical protein
VAKATNLHTFAAVDRPFAAIHHTPTADALLQSDDARLDALERDFCTSLLEFTRAGSMSGQVRMATAKAINAG